MTEGQKYLRLMLAFDGLAAGKGLTDRIIDKDDYGRSFRIDMLLAETAFASRRIFEVDDIAQVKAAFSRVGKAYPDNNIDDCVKALLKD